MNNKHLIPANASGKEIKQIIRDWVKLLAHEKYAEALEFVSPEFPHPFDSEVHGHITQWTPELLRDMIANYGMADPWPDQEKLLRVVSVTDELREAFEDHFDVDFENTYGNIASKGWIHVDLPLNFQDGNRVSDLTAILFLKSINDERNMLVLDDIHVM